MSKKADKNMKIEPCLKCDAVRKWAESMVHCTHELCSVSEATYEEVFGQDILDILNGELSDPPNS